MDYEISLHENQDSSRYHKILNYLDLSLKIKGLRLTALGKTTLKNLVSSTPDPHDPPIGWKKSRMLCTLWIIINHKLALIIWHLILLYITIKFATIAYILYEHQRLIKTLEDQESMNVDTSKTLDKLRYCSDWIEYIGAPLSTLPGVGLLYMATLAVGSLVFCEINNLAILMYWPNTQCDHLSFLFDTRGEKTRICNQLSQIIDRFYKYPDSATSLWLFNRPKYGGNHVRQSLQFDRSFRERAITVNPRDKVILKATMERLSKDRYKPDHSDLVWPCIVSLKWRKTFAQYNIFWTKLAEALGCSVFVLFIIGLSIYELVKKAQQRVLRFQQTVGRQPQTTYQFHSDPYRLGVFNSTSDQEFYSSFSFENQQPSLYDLFYLAFNIESKYHYSTTRCTTTLQFFVWGLFVSYIASSTSIFFCMHLLYKITWLSQILKQFTSLTRLSGENRLLNDDVHPSWIPKSQLLRFNETLLTIEKNSTVERLRDDIVSCYLNFELYRQHSRSNEKVENLILFEDVCFGVAGLISTYLVTINLQFSDIVLFIMITLALIMVVINSSMGLCAVKLRLVYKIMRELCYLISHCSYSQLLDDPMSRQMCLLMDLWRRQALSDEESRSFFAAKLFGVHMTSERLVTINAYFGAICLIMYKLTLD